MRTSILIFSLLSVIALFGQETEQDIELITDSTFIETDEDIAIFQEVSDLDPQRAALLSAILPGMGQVYNRQYWKVPLIYGGLAVFGHFISYNNELHHAFRNAAIAESNGLDNPFGNISSTTESLRRNSDSFLRNRDYLIILGSIFYILNIVDAHVSAHLDEFNVNEDLSFFIEPSVEPTPFANQALGLSFVIKF